MAADIDYPCRLPGVLVNSNSFSPKNTVLVNELSSGPPLFQKQDDDSYVMFNVTWSFDRIQAQVFQNWYSSSLQRGSASFNIGLMINGDDGSRITKDHECYFFGAPNYQQNGVRWMVSAQLLAIEEAILSECDGLSLVAAFVGFDYDNLDNAIDDVDSVIVLLEDIWLP